MEHLDRLDRNIRTRNDRERAFIRAIKDGLRDIVAQMQQCNQSLPTANASQKQEIIRRMQNATRDLNNYALIADSNSIVDPFRNYANQYIKNDRRTGGRNRKSTRNKYNI